MARPLRFDSTLDPIFLVLAAAGLLIVHTVFSSAATPDRYTVSRLPIEVERVAPVSLVERQSGHLFVDFGQDSFGGLELTIPHPEPGQKLAVSLGEALSGPQTMNRHPGGSVRFLASQVILDAGKNTYLVPLTPKDSRLVSGGLRAVMPFRYVEIDGAPSDFKQDDIRQLTAHYHFDDAAATFESSDSKLNAIWKLCDHTMKATSFAGVFIDGDRERHPYEADAYINQLGWYSCTSDTTLPRYSWEYLVDHPTWPTEWILFNVLLAWNDYQYTGDLAGLKEFYPDLEAKTLLALERPDGLISTVTPPVPKEAAKTIHINGIRDLVDWPPSERDGYEMKPVNTVVNAFHALALERMAGIARAVGHLDDAARFEAASTMATKSLNEKLVDPATGLYVDGEGSRHSSVHANLFPLAFGLVPAPRRARVASFLAKRGMVCSVYAAQFLLEALFDHGKANEALALMTATRRSWNSMIGDGATMTWEAWDMGAKPNMDWNHAWGAAPANIIPRKIMGIEPLAPGFSHVLIQPRPGSLQWARIRVPTVRGSLSVQFQNQAGFRMEVDLPPDTVAKIGIPQSASNGSARILMDGKPVEGTLMGDTVFIDGVGPGRHTLGRR